MRRVESVAAAKTAKGERSSIVGCTVENVGGDVSSRRAGLVCAFGRGSWSHWLEKIILYARVRAVLSVRCDASNGIL